MKTLKFCHLATIGILAMARIAPAAGVKVEQTEVGPVTQDAQYVTSPEGAHLATISRKGSRMTVTLDGAAGPRFDEIVPVMPFIDPRGVIMSQGMIRQVVFSHDGRRYAYLGRQGQEWVLMSDGKEMLRLTVANPNTVEAHIAFAGPDGKHLMFSHSAFAGYELWVDGHKMPGTYSTGGGGTEGTVDPLITSDGAHYAYVAQIDRNKRTVILDGRDAGYIGDNLNFTADGLHLLSLMRQGQIVSLAVDGKPRMKTDGITQLVMAPVSNGFAAVLQRLTPPGQFLVVDAKRVAESDCQSITRVLISPDGKHYAAICTMSPTVQYVLIDGKKGQQYTCIYYPDKMTFSADSSKVAYVAQSANKFFVVVNDDESDAFETTPNFMFSRDGKHIVMNGVQNTRSPQSPGGVIQSTPTYIDGKAERVARSSGLDTFAFSPDMTRHAYFAGSMGLGAGEGQIYLDGKDAGLAGNFTFSPDSRHIAVAGYRISDSKHGFFVDGKLAYTCEHGVRFRAFSPDSQHVYWMALEPAKSGTPGAFDYVTYVDGKEAVRCDQDLMNVAQIYNSLPGGECVIPPSTWHIEPDGSLTMLGAAGDLVSRYHVSPPVDTSVSTLLAAAPAK